MKKLHTNSITSAYMLPIPYLEQFLDELEKVYEFGTYPLPRTLEVLVQTFY